MVRPAAFGFNAETAQNNVFQHADAVTAETHRLAVAEFDAVVSALEARQIKVLVVVDTPDPVKPDAVFPNNWITFHDDGIVVVYPMRHSSRRIERRPEIIKGLENVGYVVKSTHYLDHWESEDKFLEGTGSMVIDRQCGFIYACLSQRTNLVVLHEVAHLFDYKVVAFNACDECKTPIYHTNVMMWIGTKLCGICPDAIVDENERSIVVSSLRASGRQLIELSLEQVQHFCGNMLELQSAMSDRPLLVMSENARDALTVKQTHIITDHCDILSVPIPTIERVGGGGIRCMLAEMFLPCLPRP